MLYIDDLFKDVLMENEDYEFKQRLNTKETESWSKSLSAFSNSGGGIIFVGVGTEGELHGLDYKETDQTKRLVNAEIDLHLFPHINVRFIVRPIDDEATRFVVGIIIENSDEIVLYRGGKYSERVYQRKDGESVPVTLSKLQMMLNKRKSLEFDNVILDRKFVPSNFKSLFEAHEQFKPDEGRLDPKRFKDIGAVGEDNRLTYGMSLFEDDCDDSNTQIDCRYYDGFGKEAPVNDFKTYKGNLIGGYRFMKDFIGKNTKTGYKKAANGGQIALFSYYPKSIDEVLINALAHRDYSINGTQINVDIFKDQMVISSPGEWISFNDPNKSDWTRMVSKRRNKIICDVFFLVGLMEKAGSGFKQLYLDYKNEERKPEFYDSKDYFSVTLFDLLFKEEDAIRPKTNETEAIETQLVYERIQGDRPYDDLVLMACYDKPLKREEIQKMTTYKSPNSILKEIINPLLEKGYLLKTKANKAPNQSYRTNKELVKKK